FHGVTQIVDWITGREQGHRPGTHRSKAARGIRDSDAQPPGDNGGQNSHGRSSALGHRKPRIKPRPYDEIRAGIQFVEKALCLRRFVLAVAVELNDSVITMVHGVAQPGTDGSADTEVVW